MRFSSLTDRIRGDRVAAWDIHFAAWAAQARGEDVIVLSVGDPDFDTPEPVRDAAIAALHAGDTHYTPISGRPELRAALEEGRKQPLPVLYDIKVLPGSMTPGFDSWWRVGVAEVSTQPGVQRAYAAMRAEIQKTRDY